MSCTNPVLDEDGERICECGDEGRMCSSCREAAATYWHSAWMWSLLSERDEEAYERDLRDAGRGHLLP